MFPIADDNIKGQGIAWVSIGIIVACIGVFFFLQLGEDGEEFTYAFSAVPYEITTGEDLTDPERIQIQGQVVEIPHQPGPSPIHLTLVTSMFMHGGLLHLAGNMLFLWVFGDNVEHRLGPLIFIAFYLLTGVAGALAQIMVNPDSVIPMLGASGAISGVLGAYLVLFPGNRVLFFVFRFLVRLPAWVAIGLWAAFQFIGGFTLVGGEAAGGVAYMAHIGGFLAGVLAGFVFRVTHPGPSRRGFR
jgi:membrane associated rhomboid family serine protease